MICSVLEVHRCSGGEAADERDLGDLPIINKIRVITKIKDGVVKKRMILDTQASSVKEATQKGNEFFCPGSSTLCTRSFSL